MESALKYGDGFLLPKREVQEAKEVFPKWIYISERLI